MLFNENGGMIAKLSDSGNTGILVFLVMLGILVSLLNKAGGSAAFGKWASKHIKTRIGAQLSVMVLGILIFVDDYFNCLTVGSVLRPVTDRHKVSRAKLSYIIDATAAPVCIIAPIRKTKHQTIHGLQLLHHPYRKMLELTDLQYLSRQFHIICMRFLR